MHIYKPPLSDEGRNRTHGVNKIIQQSMQKGFEHLCKKQCKITLQCYFVFTLH